MSVSDQTVVGGRELSELLQTLPKKVERNIMRAALRAGATVMREETKQRVPVSSGALRKSVRITTRAKGGEISASVKAGNSVAFYAHMIEFGTRPHKIVANKAKALSVPGTPVRVVEHPGSRPRPFMRPAADAAFHAAVDAVQKKIRERLTREGINTPAPIPQDPPE